MTRAEFIAEMSTRGWSMEDIKEQLDLHDEMESENEQTLSFDLFLVDNPASSIKEYRIREEGGWEDVGQAS
jgi:hypothetical protein|nr:MAG TPA: hypothetical protein [Caudoviricetes sp.]DAX50306.1 MAG TPA: hypothetical protein [Caudoviricetes sp.]